MTSLLRFGSFDDALPTHWESTVVHCFDNFAKFKISSFAFLPLQAQVRARDAHHPRPSQPSIAWWHLLLGRRRLNGSSGESIHMMSGLDVRVDSRADEPYS